MESQDSKSFWGSSMWKAIHSAAVAYKPSMRNSFKRYIELHGEIIPCESCRKHFKENLKILPIDQYLETNEQAFYWTYLFHDIVNRRLGKKSPPYTDIKRIYFKGVGIECLSCKV